MPTPDTLRTELSDSETLRASPVDLPAANPLGTSTMSPKATLGQRLKPKSSMIIDSDSEDSDTITTSVNSETETPTDDMVRELAKSLYNGTCRSVPTHESATWIGDSSVERSLVRKAYMEIFDWEGLSVLGALRGLCEHLYMKAESQQIDRIVDAFSERWCACNPNHGFKATSVVYTLAYSILLLNTDHHSQEYAASKKMPRSQYVQSTLQAMSALATAEAGRPGKKPTQPQHAQSGGSYYNFTTRRRVVSKEFGSPSENNSLVYVAKDIHIKEWEAYVNALLRSVYASVDMNPLSLAKSELDARQQPSVNNGSKRQSFIDSGNNSIFSRRSWVGSQDNWSDYDFSDAVANNNLSGPAVRRSSASSTAQKSGYRNSILGPSISSNSHNIGFAGALRTTIIREEQEKMDPSENDPPTSLEAPKMQYLEKVPSTDKGLDTSVSINSSTSGKLSSHTTVHDNSKIDVSLASCAPQKTSSSIYSRNEQESLVTSLVKEPIQEEPLTLNGAPWAKEGLLQFQAFFDKGATPKRYKKKGWTQAFMVVQGGYFKMFQFDKDTPKKRGFFSYSWRTNKPASQKGVETTNIGSGNWADNATMIDCIPLCHTMAQIIHIAKDGTDLLGVFPESLTKGGKKISSAAHDGANVQFSLKLPTGGVLAFLAGTREIADEYVYTCNYWASRVSREPLIEAVTSSEFGWGKPLDLVFGAERKKESDLVLDETLPEKWQANASTVGDNSLTRVCSATDIDGAAKSKELIHKKSAPNLSTSSKQLVQEARLNLRRSSFLSTTSVNSTISSIINRNAVGMRQNLIKSNNVSIQTTSASTASASATAAATTLLKFDKQASASLADAANAPLNNNGIKTTTRCDNKGGVVITRGTRKTFLVSGSNDTVFINNAKVQITEWRPPVQSVVHSELDEAAQLDNLLRYTVTVMGTLQDHRALGPELLTVFPRDKLLVSRRVQGNWERRNQYLMNEVVKYEIYTSTLKQSILARQKLEAGETCT